MEDNICPGCGRHCSLDAPNCGRGVQYARAKAAGENVNAEQKAFDRETAYKESDTDGKLLWNLRDIGQNMRAMHDGKDSQTRILVLLYRSEGMTQSELTERLGIQSGSASEVIGKLERAELITRVSSEKDRRTCEIALTEKGKAMAVEAIEKRKSGHAEVFSSLSDDEKAELLRLLEKLNGDMRERFGGQMQFCKCDRHHRHEHEREHGHGCGHEHEHGHGCGHGCEKSLDHNDGHSRRGDSGD